MSSDIRQKIELASHSRNRTELITSFHPSQLESQGSAQEVAITKLQSQEANLTNSLSKMVVLSKGLAKDKVELNRILLQVSGEPLMHIIHTHNLC